jgi:hypothetical protein
VLPFLFPILLVVGAAFVISAVTFGVVLTRYVALGALFIIQTGSPFVAILFVAVAILLYGMRTRYFILGSGSVRESCCGAAEPRLGARYDLLPYQCRCVRGRCGGERNRGRQIFSKCKRESESEPERASRSGHPRAVIH